VFIVGEEVVVISRVCAKPEPQALLAVTDIVPGFTPTV
jgi:hypothetical protein